MLGKRISQARDAADITQRELARRFDVEQSTVYRWEADKSFPGLPRLKEMASLFGVTEEWLVLGKGDGPSPKDPEPAQESA